MYQNLLYTYKQSHININEIPFNHFCKMVLVVEIYLKKMFGKKIRQEKWSIAETQIYMIYDFLLKWLMIFQLHSQI